MNKQNIFISILIFFTTFTMYSQEYIVKGNVKNKQNEVLAGVNITNNKNSVGTQTDLNGEFTITFNQVDAYEFIFSYLGYKTNIISVNVSRKIY